LSIAEKLSENGYEWAKSNLYYKKSAGKMIEFIKTL
jgi:hypothetical protein